MVYIVAGKINSGKTTKLLSLYEELRAGDGFILPKVYIEGNYAGQQIVRLSTGTGIPFSFRTGYIPACWNEKYRHDVYSFSQEGFIFARNIARNIVVNNITPVFIDEIGPLELQKKGFFHIFSLLLQKSDVIYVSVRESCLEKIVKFFRIKEYRTI